MKLMAGIVLCLVFAVACRDDQSQTESNVTTAVPVDTLSAVLQIGTDLADSTTAFWFITDAAIDNRGNILVLDRIDASLKIFSSEGEYLGNAARSGNGPGELVLPWDMFTFNDGRLMVLDPGTGFWLGRRILNQDTRLS